MSGAYMYKKCLKAAIVSWPISTKNLQDVNKLLIEELCLVSLETGIDAHMFLNYKTYQSDNLIEYMYDESTLMINTPPSTTLSGIPHCH